MSTPIYVTRPHLPPLSRYVALLESIWQSHILTNSGPFHDRLEARLSAFLGAPHIALTANGMLALNLAIDAAGLDGEIITTPYSFVATSHAIRLGNLTPVFADIQADGFNIDPVAIEAAITPRTCAIVAVHCYGIPCDVAAIEKIARKHGLCVIYDAAHAFGVSLDGRSIFSHGDFSALSFHATKVFSTIEGGAVVSATAPGKALIEQFKNFGIVNEVEIPQIGTNAKLSELHAAFGLLQLDAFPEILAGRRRVDALYRKLLAEVDGIEIPAEPLNVERNYSYFPVLVSAAFPMSRDGLYDELKRVKIFSRRYFYPLLSNLPMYVGFASAAEANLPVANRVVEQVLCLPIYPDLSDTEVEKVCLAIKRAVATAPSRAR